MDYLRKFILFVFGFVSLFCINKEVIAQSPGGVSDKLQLWFKADAGVEEASGDAAEHTDPVEFWRDQSGNGFDGDQETLNDRPVLDASNLINFNPVISFPSNDYFPIRDLGYVNNTTVDSMTIYTIIRTNETNEGVIVSYDRNSFFRFAVNHNTEDTYGFSSWNGTQSDFEATGTAVDDGDVHMIGADYDGGTATDNIRLYLDGTINSTTSNGTGFLGAAVPRFGFIGVGSEATTFDGDQGPTNYYDGDIAEIVYYEGVLNATERNQVESYLAMKYGITIPGDYIAADGTTTLWNSTTNAAYHNDIAAIGVDNASGLNQLRSTAEADVTNFTVFDDDLASEDYLVWGHNDNNVKFRVQSGLPVSHILERVWKVEISGSSTVIDSIIVAANSSGMNPTLFIDDNPDFTSPNAVSAATFADGTASFVDVDFSSFAGDIYVTAGADVLVPGNLSVTPQLWFKADFGVEEADGDNAEDADQVEYWRDLAGGGNDGIQSTISERPVFSETNTINNNPVITFDGTDDYLPIANVNYQDNTTLDAMTIYAVTKTTSATERIIVSYDRSSFFRLSNQAGGQVHFSTAQGSTITDFNSGGVNADNGRPHILGADFDGITSGEKRIYFDGATTGTVTPGTGFLGNTAELPRYGFIGTNSEAATFDGVNSTGTEFSGDIAEIILYDTILSETNRNKIETYLSLRYGVTIEHDYLASDAAVVWDAAVNATYHNDVAGIAQDVDAVLSQSRSSSENAGAVMTMEDAALNNGDYLIWGNDGNDAQRSELTGTTFTHQVGRIWKLDITGATNDLDSIIINVSGYEAIPENIASHGLIIDDNESFNSPVEISPISVSGNVLRFSNVDFSSFGGDIYLSYAIEAYTPAAVNANPTFWFMADTGVEEASDDTAEDGDRVNIWKDQSVNGYNGEQSAIGERPIYDATNTINHNPVLEFTGPHHFPIRDLSYTDNTSLNQVTAYSIVKTAKNTGEGIILSYDRSSFFRLANDLNNGTRAGWATFNGAQTDQFTAGTPVIDDGYTHLFGGDYDGASSGDHRVFIDGNVETNNVGTGFLGNTGELPRYGYIGTGSEAATFNSDGSPENYFEGSMAELIYFEGVLNATDRNKIETYLAIKYGITLSTNYLAADGTTTVWDATTNAGYNNMIAGIARDIESNFSQLISLSEDSSAILSVTDAGLVDNDYVLWGSDDATIALTTSGTGSSDARITRQWKFQLSGATDNIDQLSFNLNSLTNTPNSAGDYVLMMDDNASFSSPTEINTGSLSDGIISFANVDFSTGEVFVRLALDPDLDSDGVADLDDLDVDNDGIPNANEGDGIVDTDSDGIPDSRDLDSDNDGIPDLYESGAENSGTTLAILDANSDGVVDAADVGINGLSDALETLADNGILAYTINNDDGDGVPDYRDLDTDNDGISDLVESGLDLAQDVDDDGLFEGDDLEEDGIVDVIDENTDGFGTASVSLKDQDAVGEPDFRDLDSDDDGTEDIDEVNLVDTTPDDGRLDGGIDADGDGIEASRDDDEGVFGGINIEDLTSGEGILWYSYTSGDWSDPDNWTLDPSGSTRINPSMQVPNSFIDKATILNGREITMDLNNVILTAMTVNDGGILDLGETMNHSFDTIKGIGRIQIASDEFPDGDASNFSSASGGTIEYIDKAVPADYELVTARSFNNMIINSASNTIVLKADYNLEGDLTINNGTFQINDNTSDSFTDNTTPLNLIVNGNVTVSAGASLLTGNVDAATKLTANGVFVFHQFEILGDFTNEGTVRFTNLNGTSIADGRYRDKYPTADDEDNFIAPFITSDEYGVVEVLFTNPLADQFVTCNNVTDFYRIEVKKGTSQTFMVELNASSTSNFRLLGRISMNQSDDSDDVPNIDNNRALGLEAGILKLGNNIVIDQIAKNDTNGMVPSTQGGNRNYIVDLDAQLWLASNSVVSKGNDWGIHPFGKLKISDDATLDYTGSSQRGILIDNQGTYEQIGGTVNIGQFRNKTGADGAPRGSFIFTGGILNVGEVGEYDGHHAIFSVPWEEQNFILKAEDPSEPPVLNIYLNGRTKDNPEAAFQVGAKEGNYDIGESTVNFIKTNGRDYALSSSVPFYDLSIDFSAGGEIMLDTIVDAHNNFPGVTPDDNSGSTASPSQVALPLVVENNFTILDGVFNADGFDVTVGNLFTIADGGQYNPGTNTTIFNGASAVQVIRINGVTPFIGDGFNNIQFSNSGTEKEFQGSLSPVVIVGDLIIDDGVTLDDNGKTIQVNGDIYNSGNHITDISSPGSIEIAGGSSSHEIGGDGTGVFKILDINDALNPVALIADQRIDSVINLLNGVLDLDNNALTIASTATNPIRDDAGDTINFRSTKMIQTSGNATDGGLIHYFDGSTADPSAVFYPIGTDANGIARYTPAFVDLESVSNDGYVRISPVDGALSTADTSAGEEISYYWRMTHADFGGANPILDSLTLRYDESDVDGGANESLYVPGKVLDISPYSRSSEEIANLDDVANTIVFDDGFALDSANYTAGEAAVFLGSPTIYYTRNTDRDSWDDVTKWSLSPDGSTADGLFPGAGDIAVIRTYGEGNDNSWVEIDADVSVAQLVFQNNGGWQPRVIVRDQSATVEFGTVSGTEGQIQVFIDETDQPTFNNTDLGDFSANFNSQFNYVLTADATNPVPLINTISEYPTLRLEAGGSTNFSQRRLRNTIPITINNDLILDWGSRFYPGADVTISDDIRMRTGGNGGQLEFPTDVAVTICVGDDIDMDGSANIQMTVDNTVPNSLAHTLQVGGDVIRDGGSGVFDMFNGNGTDNNTILELKDTTHATYTDNSSNLADLYRVVMNKGTDSTFSFTFNNDFDLGGLTSGAEKRFELQNGKLIINNASIEDTLSSGGDDFNIPSTAALEISNGTLRVTSAGSGAGNGIRLDGRLVISGGSLIMDGGSGADTYIEYGSAGGAAIEVTAGSLLVGSQLRRNPLSNDGVLNYSQTGGEAYFGFNAAPENARGVFEILNTGAANSSSFNLSGASTTFVIAGSQASPSNGTLTFGSDVAINVTDDAIIDFGNNGTVAGVLIQNAASALFQINSAVSIPNIRIDDDNHNAPVVRIINQPLTVTNNLQILNTGTLDADGIDLTVNNEFTNDGTYTTGANTTVFNGVAQTIAGTTNTSFNNLIVSPTTSLTLSSPTTVNGDLNINSGTLIDGGNEITLLGDLFLTSAHAGTGGITMSGVTGEQLIDLPDRAGAIGLLTINNADGVTLDDNLGAAVELTVNEELAINNGLFNIEDNRVILDNDADVTTSSSFGIDRMISVNGVKKSDGVEKEFLAATTYSSLLPIGTPGKYAPVTISITSSDDPGSLLFKPINSTHPSAIGPDALSYYWVVTTDPTSVSNFIGDISFQYEEVDATGGGRDETMWTGVRLINPEWSKPPGAEVNSVNNTITFDQSDLSAGGLTSFDGEYSAGDVDDFPDILARFRSNTIGVWNDAANWDIDRDGDGNYDEVNGDDNPLAEIPQPGTQVIINTGDTITMNTATDDNQNLFSVEILTDAALDVNDSDGHNFGDVSGNGTLKVSNPVLPGGNYDDFFNLGDGILHLAGTGSYTIAPDFTDVRGLIISGGGVKTLPSIAVNVGADGITILDGATLNNALNNNDIIVGGNVDVINGTIDLGNGLASLIADTVTMTAGTFTASGADLDLSGNLDINGGTYNAGSGTIAVAGDVNLAGAATFNNGSGDLLLDGTVDQRITGDFSTETFNNVEVNKPSGDAVIAASSLVHIANTLTLNGGIINTEASGAVLRMLNGVGSIVRTSGFISGPLQVDLENGDDFTFPVGKGSRMKIIGINGISGQSGTTTWESEYYPNTASGFSSAENTIDAGSFDNIETNADSDEQVVHLNGSEHWRITTGADPATVASITLDVSNSGVTTDEINDELVQILVWDEAGDEWDHLGGLSSGLPSSVNTTSTSSLSFSEHILLIGSEDPGSTLPVELLSFTAEQDGEVIVLDWVTATEIDNDYFEVERSYDGREFEVLGRITGNGTTNKSSEYSLTDFNPLAGTNYYRLKQVDFDGTTTYFDIVAVQNSSLSSVFEVVVYPNPTSSNNINFRTKGSLTGNVRTEVVLRDMTGKISHTQVYESTELTGNKLELTHQLSAGVYFLEARQGLESEIVRIIVK